MVISKMKQIAWSDSLHGILVPSKVSSVTENKKLNGKRPLNFSFYIVVTANLLVNEQAKLSQLIFEMFVASTWQTIQMNKLFLNPSPERHCIQCK